MTDELVDENLVTTWRECFDIYDKYKEGYITSKLLPDVFRLLHIEISENQLDTLIDELKIQSPNGNEEIILFEDFIFMMIENEFPIIKEEDTLKIFEDFERKDIPKTNTVVLDDLDDAIKLLDEDQPVLFEDFQDLLVELKIDDEEDIDYPTVLKHFYRPNEITADDEEIEIVEANEENKQNEELYQQQMLQPGSVIASVLNSVSNSRNNSKKTQPKIT